MAVVEVDIASDQRELVRSGRQLRQELGESNAGRAGGDRGERPAVFGRCLGLGIKEIQVARPAPQPDEQDRLRLRGFGRGRGGPGPGDASANGAATPAAEMPGDLRPGRS